MSWLRGVAVAMLTASVVAGCSSGSGEDTEATTPSPAPSAAGPVLNGLYKIDFDVAKRTQLGAPSPRTEPLSARWALDSHCAADDVCIATGTRIKPDGSPTNIQGTLDLIDGNWVMVIAEDSKCRAGGQPARVLGTWVLTPQPNDTLSGTWTEITTGPDCPWVVQMPVTVSRQGEIPQGVQLIDPTVVEARKPSKAQAFSGTYTQTITTQPPDGAPGVLNIDVATFCVRNTDECASTQATVIDNNPQITPLMFTGDRWTYRWDRGEKSCGPGTPERVRSFGFDEIMFPQPSENPIVTLSGLRRLEAGEPCPTQQTFDLKYDRVAAPPTPAPAPAPGG